MAQQKNVRFAELLILHLNNKIKKNFGNASLTSTTLKEIRDMVRGTCHDVFSKSSHRLSENSINWIANQFFKSINLGTTDGKMNVNDLVVINEYKLADLPYHDIQLMRNLFNETSLGGELTEEFRRRTTS